MGEDAAVSYPALLNAKRAAVIENTMYHYRQHEGSMLKKKTGYSAEAEKLISLHRNMMAWVKTADPELKLEKQVTDMILALALMRSGGVLPAGNYSACSHIADGKDVVVYSASTFGQQMVNRLNEFGRCRVTGWIDPMYKDYRRVCLDVDPVESVRTMSYDYILIAKINQVRFEEVKQELIGLGVDETKILTPMIPEDRQLLCRKFLDAEAFRKKEQRR